MKKNKKKQLPLLLLALLLITTAAYGTRAYFTDSAEQKANIQLTLGDLNIDKENAVEWTYGNTENSKDYNKKLAVTKTGTQFQATKVQPGDTFTGTFTFTNAGTLDQKVTVNTEVLDTTKNTFNTTYSYYIDTITELKPLQSDIIVEANKKIHIVATISIPTDLTGEFAETGFNTASIEDNTLNALDQMITVKATQSNQQ